MCIVGISAGAIHMGSHGYYSPICMSSLAEKVVFPFATLGLAPSFIFGAHAEEDEWRECQAAINQIGGDVLGMGIVAQGAAILHTDGTIEPCIKPLIALAPKQHHVIGHADVRPSNAKLAELVRGPKTHALAPGRRYRVLALDERIVISEEYDADPSQVWCTTLGG